MKEKPTLILHVGTHKTGTSSIQTFLMKNSRLLEAEGLIYLPTPIAMGRPRKAHHQIARCVAEEQPGSEDWRLLEEYLERLRAMASGARAAIISSERLWRSAVAVSGQDSTWEGRAAFLERLAGLLDGFDVKVHAFFRRQDEMIASSGRGKQMRGLRPAQVTGADAPPEDWLDPLGSTEPSNLPLILSYHRNLQCLAQAFSRQSIRAHKYEPKARGKQFVVDTLARMGIPLAEPSRFSFDADVHSYPEIAALPDFFCYVVRQGDDGTRIRKLLNHVLDGRVLDHLDTWLKVSFERRFEDLGQVLSGMDHENERLRAEYFPEEEDPLFGREVEHLLPVHVPLDTRATIAKADEMRQMALGQM